MKKKKKQRRFEEAGSRATYALQSVHFSSKIYEEFGVLIGEFQGSKDALRWDNYAVCGVAAEVGGGDTNHMVSVSRLYYGKKDRC